MPPEVWIDIPDLNYSVDHLWRWFNELSLFRRQAFAGVHPLVWADIGAWAAIQDPPIVMREWEKRALAAIDQQYVNVKSTFQDQYQKEQEALNRSKKR